MSTPLPIDNNTTLPLGGTKPAGDQAMMCVWDEGWAAIGGGLIRFVTSVFDIGDGWLSRQ
jgi:hypothetical protein